MTYYSGAWPVIQTPYDVRMEIDCGVYRTLIEWYIQREVGGLYANCLSSEMFALSPAERLLLVRETVAVSAGRTPVAATGNFGADLGEHAEFCRRVAGAGADVVMLTVPEFINNDAELETYLFALAEQVDAPLGLYECPVPRHYHLGVALVEKLARSGRFVAFKETSCDLEKISAHIRVTSGTPLALLQANTPYLLETVRRGAPGSMSIAAGWAPELVKQVIDLTRAGDPRAETLHDQLCAMDIAERAVHPLGVKYLLARRGLPISMRSRTNPDPLAVEVLYALDRCARAWFQEEHR
jgi:4-hydroxy-tetrahydrodipicolinate synthase